MFHPSSGQRPDHRVALVRCGDYSSVSDALATGFDLLGGIEKFYSPGENLLLKPNMLLGDHPERGSTTPPAFFEAVAKAFISKSVKLFYGDSPGFGAPQGAAHSTGLSAVAEKLGIELSEFVEGVDTPNPQGKLIKQFHIAEGLFEVDDVINLPKFKTHGLTRLTGAVKNLFGCVPGVQKAAFHARLQNEMQFGEMLVDLAEFISPRLHIMDGVIGMEGNGPRNGKLRQVGVVLMSTNPHALDHCAARIMNLDPMLVPTLKVAFERRIYQPENIQILGESIESLILDDFDVNRSRTSTTGNQVFYMDLFKNWVTPRPVIDPDKCSHCGRCVSVCPVEPKAVQFLNGRGVPPRHNYTHCIRCYCCQEMCPDEAISIEMPALGRLFDKIRI